VERARGDFAAAEAQFREALALARPEARARPGDVIDALDGLAGVLLDQGKSDEALPLLEEALTVVQALPDADPAALRYHRRALGLGRLAAGNAAGAREIARPGLGDPPVDAEWAIDLLTLAGGPDVDWAEPLRMAGDAVKARPNDAWMRYLFGAALSRAGRFAEAEPHLNAVTDPTSSLWVVTRLYLAANRARRGEAQAARALMAEADRAVAAWAGPYATARQAWPVRLRAALVRRELERLLAEPPEPVPPPAVRG
jgi:tetratricopeptide (TPR) repeat protein